MVINVDLISVYRMLDTSLIKTLKAVNVLTEHEEESNEYIPRLRERKYFISESVKRNVSVVTAHDLKQYKNNFNTVRVEDVTPSWVTELLKVDEENE